MGKDRFTIGKIPLTQRLVDEYFSDSTGDEGETDAVGPWNKGGEWKIVEAPEIEKGVENLTPSDGKSSKSGEIIVVFKK